MLSRDVSARLAGPPRSTRNSRRKGLLDERSVTNDSAAVSFTMHLAGDDWCSPSLFQFQRRPLLSWTSPSLLQRSVLSLFLLKQTAYDESFWFLFSSSSAIDAVSVSFPNGRLKPTRRSVAPPTLYQRFFSASIYHLPSLSRGLATISSSYLARSRVQRSMVIGLPRDKHVLTTETSS